MAVSGVVMPDRVFVLRRLHCHDETTIGREDGVRRRAGSGRIQRPHLTVVDRKEHQFELPGFRSQPAEQLRPVRRPVGGERFVLRLWQDQFTAVAAHHVCRSQSEGTVGQRRRVGDLRGPDLPERIDERLLDDVLRFGHAARVWRDRSQTL